MILRTSYLRGAGGYILVADGTRNDTLYKALAIQARAEETVGKVPFLLLLNKADLAEQWSVTERETGALREKGWDVIVTSAKTGSSVEGAFQTLANKMVEV